MNPLDDIRPLVARVEPIAGESLLSLVTRTAHANGFPSLSDLLSHAGLSGHPAFLPFRMEEADAERLAALLGVEAAAILERLHRPLIAASAREEISWATGKLEQRFIERRARRVSPSSLARSSHHRLAWTNRALSFCPESFELLLCACPACARPLGWTHTQGLDRCEHCRASLLDAEPKSISEAVRPALAGVAGLVAADPATRRLALLNLPSAFHGFDPGEAFTAAVELGVAWCEPQAGRGSDTARQLVTGRLAISPEVLAAGYEVLRGWPQSYGELVGRIWRAHAEGGEVTMALRRLGLLGRWFDSRLKQSALGKLLREGIIEAAERAAMPLKQPGRDPGGVDAKVLTLTEASELFAISKATLGRLVPHGACVISGKLGRGGAVRFRAAELQLSARAYRTALTPAKAAAVLGVPAYCLPALVEAGLLQSVSDRDALRMAAAPALYTRSSLDALLQSLYARCGELGFLGMPLAPMMRRLFRPTDWARVFQALVAGELKLDYALEVTNRPIMAQLQVGCEEGLSFVSSLRGEPPEMEAVLTAADVGLLLGVPAIYVGELIAAELLPASREGRSWRIALSDVVSFDRDHVLSPELLEPEVLEDGSALSRPPCDTIAYTRHLVVYAARSLSAAVETQPALAAGQEGAPRSCSAAGAQAGFEAAITVHAIGSGWPADRVQRMLRELRGHRV